MRNLAGNQNCDLFIVEELTRAGIPWGMGEHTMGEVPYTVTGKLGAFTFTRAWCYWCVSGPMPLKAAQYIYGTTDGKKAVRAGGHCCCEPPGEHLTRRAPDGREVISKKDYAEGLKWIGRLYKSREDYDTKYTTDRTGARAFVESYHIDTQEGLNLFAETVRSIGKETP